MTTRDNQFVGGIWMQHSGAILRKLVIFLFSIVIILGGWVGIDHHNGERARADWKTATLQRIAGLSATNQEIIEELKMLKANSESLEHREWIADHVLLMTNGEFLIYASRHGDNMGYIHHLFLARASDGRWFYSTYHFCNSMVGVFGEDPPGSIGEFTNRYSVRQIG